MADPAILIGNDYVTTSNGTDAQLAAEDPYFNTISPSGVMLVVLSLIALLLCVPTFVWHVRHRNAPAAIMVGWLVVGNIFNVTNAFIWPDDNVFTWWHGPGYCDVQVKLDIASAVGLLGALACLLRVLAAALDTNHQTVFPTTAQRRRRMLFDIIYCVVFPVIFAVAHFIVQPSRYYIFGIVGCYPSTSDSWLSLMILFIWPPVLCLVCGYYAALLLYRLWCYRRNFRSVLSGSGLSTSRFLRLTCTASIVLVVYVPLQIYLLARNLSAPLTTWDWEATHDPETWQTVVLVPAYGTVYPDRWIPAALAFPVFFCFGFGADAKALYRSWASTVGLGTVWTRLESSLSASRHWLRTRSSRSGRRNDSTDHTVDSDPVSSTSRTSFFFNFGQSLRSTPAHGNRGRDSFVNALGTLLPIAQSMTQPKADSPVSSTSTSPPSIHIHELHPCRSEAIATVEQGEERSSVPTKCE